MNGYAIGFIVLVVISAVTFWLALRARRANEQEQILRRLRRHA